MYFHMNKHHKKVMKRQKNIQSTLVCLIAEQGLLREQDGIFLEKVKRAGPNKRAGWIILKK